MSGGGTGGHIIPNIALIHELRERFSESGSLELLYIGSSNGMEAKMIQEVGVDFVGISCGKLRRYFSFRNFLDFFRIPVGIIEAWAVLMKFRPDVIFCKGGYVSFPVAVAGWMLNIPVILHESDVSPGLANRMCARFARVICTSFEESRKYFKHKKVVFTGNPVRRELAFANRETGLQFLDFSGDLPIILIIGGSLGAEFLNLLTWKNLDYLLPHFQVAHICGRGNVKDSLDLLKYLGPEHQKYLAHYRAFEFLDHELKDVFAASDLIISRAGAISLAEMDFFEKPAILIPLGKKASRGDQILNAEVFAKNHLCKILHEGEFSDMELFEDIKTLLVHRKNAHVGHTKDEKFSALDKIIKLLERP